MDNTNEEAETVEAKYQAHTKGLIDIITLAIQDEVKRCAEFGMYPGPKDFRIAIEEALGHYYG